MTDVLINNLCANVSNITWSSGNDFGDVNGIAHFLEPSGGFPFSEGIILSSGNALRLLVLMNPWEELHLVILVGLEIQILIV